jgi:hypothetical protein
VSFPKAQHALWAGALPLPLDCSYRFPLLENSANRRGHIVAVSYGTNYASNSRTLGFVRYYV